MNKPLQLLVLSACLIAVIPRLLSMPFEWNLSALGALALLCGATVQPRWLALLIPLGCRFLTDCWLEARTGHGFYNSMLFDYAAYGLICLLGCSVGRVGPLGSLLSGIGSAILFFVVSNFGVWILASDHYYARDLSGLLNCYTAAVPFARGTFLGDIAFSLIFFGLLNYLPGLQTRSAVSEEPAMETPGASES
ncbi:MAG: hypothetical protein KDA91_11960 [Planctomycetaceae bacterium]|nr:hypothetical protein [Planctomycetaceae bacterium]